jgi:hypothetical protein
MEQVSIKVIETNLSIHANTGEIMDHQARVIEVESWDSYIEEILTGDAVYRKALLGDDKNENMEGYSFPLNGIIEDFKSDGHHLSYITTSGSGMSKSLAFLIE